jgi:hypothetical protein
MKLGKTESDNIRNFKLWENNCPEDLNNCPEYDPCIDYPGKMNKFFSAKPIRKKNCQSTKKINPEIKVNPIGFSDTSDIRERIFSDTPDIRERILSENTDKTIIFQRHAFSCANLSKSKGTLNTILENEKDPSLCIYGILSVLSLNRTSVKGNMKSNPTMFEGTVFVSSLIRTWQTAILEFAPLTNNLEIIISPYIIEGGMGDTNKPLDEPAQRYKMTQFMILLQNIFKMLPNGKREKIEKVLQCNIKIKKENEVVFLYQSGEIINVIRRGIVRLGGFRIPNYNFEYNPTTIPSSFNAVMRELPTKDIYTTYYGELGFGYFYKWVEMYHIKNIFVISHGNFMRTVLKTYAGFTKEQTKDYFDENVWRFQITNNTVVLSHGIRKPNQEELRFMNDEPLCYRTITEQHRQPHQAIIYTPREQQSPNPSSILTTGNPPSDMEEYSSILAQKTVKTPYGVEESKSESFPSPPISPARPLRTVQEFRPCEMRSFQELIILLKKYSHILFSFINKLNFEVEEIKQFISTIPDFFQNHIIFCTLFHLPSLLDLVEIKIKNIYWYARLIPKSVGRNWVLRKATSFYLNNFYEERFPGVKDINLNDMDLDNVVIFLNKLIYILKSKEISDFLCKICLPKVNYSYYYRERSSEELKTQVLAEASINPDKTVEIEKMNEPEIIHCFTLLDMMVFRIEKEHYLSTQEDLNDYFDIISRLINDGARFSINGELQPLDTRGREKHKYIQKHLFSKLTIIPYYADFAMDVIGENSEKITNGAGTRRIKGTSWKKTSLRRPLIKPVTHRVLPYKGKRRSRVNRR